jgi:DNA-binding NtrC family response regulator
MAMTKAVAPAQRLDILMIEDDPDIAEAVSELLSQFHDVRVAKNVRETVAALIWRVPDVVLCDLHLPPYRGDVLLRIFAVEYPRVRRVLFTAAERREWAECVDRTIAHAVVAKPADLDHLLHAIEGRR